MLAGGELTAVFPEGYKGLGKHFRDRYKLQRFGRGGFVSAALRAKAPIIPCSIVGSEEIYPMLADVKLLARVLGVPYFPITPLFPLAGPAGLLPLPSKWHIAFGTPIDTADYDESAADDPMVTFELTDQVRETIQQTLFQLLSSAPQHVPRLSVGVSGASRPRRSRRPERWSPRPSASPIIVTMVVITGSPSASVTSLRIR